MNDKQKQAMEAMIAALTPEQRKDYYAAEKLRREIADMCMTFSDKQIFTAITGMCISMCEVAPLDMVKFTAEELDRIHRKRAAIEALQSMIASIETKKALDKAAQVQS